MEVTRQIPVGPGPRGLTVDGTDETLYVTNFERTHAFAPVVDLASAPLDSDTGTFSYQPIEVGCGPCSVAILDVSGLPESAQARRVSAQH